MFLNSQRKTLSSLYCVVSLIFYKSGNVFTDFSSSSSVSISGISSGTLSCVDSIGLPLSAGSLLLLRPQDLRGS